MYGGLRGSGGESPGTKPDLGFCSDLELLANLKKVGKLCLCVFPLYYISNNKIKIVNKKY